MVICIHPQVYTASGTGITALFLSTKIKQLEPCWKGIVSNIEVVAVSCVMSPEALVSSLRSWISSAADSNNHYNMPSVLNQMCKWIPYGDVNEELYLVWMYICKMTGINFDLTYAPAAWRQVLTSWGVGSVLNQASDHSLTELRNEFNVIFLHCGGHEGNMSQIASYKRKFPNLFRNTME